MRALFSYDPEEDQFIPCEELGVSFATGDVLHIINQDDPNWWQVCLHFMAAFSIINKHAHFSMLFSMVIFSLQFLLFCNDRKLLNCLDASSF